MKQLSAAPQNHKNEVFQFKETWYETVERNRLKKPNHKSPLNNLLKEHASKILSTFKCVCFVQRIKKGAKKKFCSFCSFSFLFLKVLWKLFCFSCFMKLKRKKIKSAKQRLKLLHHIYNNKAIYKQCQKGSYIRKCLSTVNSGNAENRNYNIISYNP